MHDSPLYWILAIILIPFLAWGWHIYGQGLPNERVLRDDGTAYPDSPSDIHSDPL